MAADARRRRRAAKDSGAASAAARPDGATPVGDSADTSRVGGADEESPGNWQRPLLAFGLLALFALQAAFAAHRDSVTVDEFLHLPLGLHALRTGDVRQDPINPHLPRMLAAAAITPDAPDFDPPADVAEWGYGYVFQEANAARYQQLFEHARWVTIGWSLLAALVAAAWALERSGSSAALVVLGLFALSPSLLAHGHLVTLDMPGVFGFLLTLYANQRLLDRPGTGRAAALGAALGLANLLKLSGSTLLLMVGVAWIVRMATERGSGPSAAAWARIALATALTALLVLNAGYGFDGTLAPLSQATLSPGGTLASLASAAPWLRLPLPLAFVNGVDMVLEVGRNHEPSYFLAGELSADGWWYYHLAAFALKCPLPVLFAGLGALAAWALGRGKGAREYAVFLPLVLLFAANSAFNSLDIGERHVLAAYPILFVGIAPWLAAALAPGTQADRRATTLATLAFAWLAMGTLSVAPRYLQYFHEAAGGPEGGHRYLIDSNLDWGQDLLRLGEWMDANGVPEVSLAYFGRVDPQVYGIRYTPLERGTSHGKAVVSASFLMGRPYFWWLGGRMRWVPSGTYAWLQQQKPVARVGSMFVYDLP